MQCIRQDDGLLITFGKGVQAGKTASAQTLGRWISSVILRANPELEKVSSRLTRAASTSLAFAKGVSLEAIMQAADWTSSSTFVNHYLKASMDEEGTFGRTVLAGTRNGD